MRSNRSQGFSLIEVLLAVFILGIGVISIAALFPAGISQQRQSVDDVFGPTVANNALAIIRAKLGSDDFGTFQDFDPDATDNLFVDPPWPVSGPIPPNPISGTILGDWPWLRPSFLFADDPATVSQSPAVPNNTPFDDTGSIDIFCNYRSTTGTAIANAVEYPGSYPNTAAGIPLYGIPYNIFKHGTTPPPIIITQSERYYPQVSQAYVGTGAQPLERTPRPQYVWDCMFRRFQGKIQVAIFVYRVNVPGGATQAKYTVPRNIAGVTGDPELPPLPISFDLTDPLNAAFCDQGPWSVGGDDAIPGTANDNAIVRGTLAGAAYDASQPEQAWQEPRQWILDQNNNIHRVLGRSLNEVTGKIDVELTRPIAPVLARNDSATTPGTWTDTPYFYVDTPFGWESNLMAERKVVTNLWYMPVELPVDSDLDGNEDYRLTLSPVYVTVKEL